MPKDNPVFKFDAQSILQLQEEKLKVSPVSESPRISGVYYRKLKTFYDDRGDLAELWSQPWGDTEPVAKDIAHVYFNTTHQGITKGWHVHERTFSQYTCVKGKMQIVLIDVRPKSETYLFVNQFIIGTNNPSFIKIPPGVLKGWKSLNKDSIIVNLLTSADVNDNFKIDITSLLPNIWLPQDE